LFVEIIDTAEGKVMNITLRDLINITTISYIVKQHASPAS